MTFEKVTQARFKKKSSFIADQILLMINSGRYKAGSKLPSERIITEQMGVSRPSLREAISALQIVGILESRPGDGTYVCGPAATEDLVRQALDVLEECDSPYENMQARKALEIGAAQLEANLRGRNDGRRRARNLEFDLAIRSRRQSVIGIGHVYFRQKRSRSRL